VGYETVRENFFGDIYRTYANPRAVAEGKCTNFLAEGENGCGTFQADLVLAPGESRELIVMLGMGTPQSHGQAAVAQFGNPERCTAEFEALKQQWHGLLEAVKSRPPIRTSTTWPTSGAPITRSSPTRGRDMPR